MHNILHLLYKNKKNLSYDIHYISFISLIFFIYFYKFNNQYMIIINLTMITYYFYKVDSLRQSWYIIFINLIVIINLTVTIYYYYNFDSL